MHGLGNDFVVLDGIFNALPPITPALLSFLGARHHGVGCDQILILSLPKKGTEANAELTIYNSDTSPAKACGNGIRCAAHWLSMKGIASPILFKTHDGFSQVEKIDEDIYRANMGAPRFSWDSIPLAKKYDTLPISYEGIAAMAVNIGNPHAVFFVEDCTQVPLLDVGPSYSKNAIFPEGANIEFATLQDAQTVRVRVYERGAGITQACGSGACAVAALAISKKNAQSPLEIHLDGGILTIEWSGIKEEPLFMTGTAMLSFFGQLPDTTIEEIIS